MRVLWLLLFLNCASCKVWDLVTRTCNKSGAGTDASVFAKVIYASTNEQELLLSASGNTFERGQKDHFRIDLQSDDIDLFGIFWWPSGTLYEDLCLDWVILLNGEDNICYMMMFNKWISHYRNPPSYPEYRRKLPYKDCVSAQ